MRNPIFTQFEDLPREIGIFPLNGALLLPGGRLPLNVFEPRYLHLVLDALNNDRIFGMIQPDYSNLPPEAANDDMSDEDGPMVEEDPPLYAIGCAGRLRAYEESEDGRLLISLTGLARFRVREELENVNGYRRVVADYSEFAADMEDDPDIALDRDKMEGVVTPYLDAQGMKMNWEVVSNLPDSTLVTSLSMICPFDPREKQALLECKDLQTRADMLLAILEMARYDPADLPGTRRQ